jgi:hypothetical protein
VRPHLNRPLSAQKTNNNILVILTGLSVWKLVEVQVGIIAACGPTLRPILAHLTSTDKIKLPFDALSIRGRKGSSSQDSPLPSFVKMDSDEALTATSESSNKSGVEEGGSSPHAFEMGKFEVDFQTSALKGEDDRAHGNVI